MRPGSSLLRKVALIALLCISPTGPEVLAAPRVGTANLPRVQLSVDQKAYPPGTRVKVQLQNNLGAKIALPGCASYSIQRFVDDAFVPVPPIRCEWEQDALVVPPGPRVFEFEPPHTERAILRAVITYGVGCREGVPLSRAGCERFETVYSAPFTVLKAADK